MEMDLSDLAEVIVLVRERKGRQHAWRVADPVRASFKIINQNGQLPIATLTATGTFRRMSRSGSDISLLPADEQKELPDGNTSQH